MRQKTSIKTFEPPARILLGPGPSNVAPRVLEAMARPTIGHLDPEFVKMMEELKELMRHVFQTDNEVTFPLSGPGSIGMETCFVNLVEPGDKVLVCCNGVFGERMLENVRRTRGVPVVVADEWGAPVSLSKVQEALASNPDVRILAFVQAETSTGALTDPEPLVTLAHEHECLTIVDTVTALGGVPVKVDEWEIDVAYAGSQKCLSCPPGLAPVTFSHRAIKAVRARTAPCQSWFMDLSLLLGYWHAGARTYHHTAPVNALYSLHEALLMLVEEGLEQAWDRHRRNHAAFAAGIDALGLTLLVGESDCLPQLNVVVVPEGIDETGVRTHLLDRFSIEIGAGLGELSGRVWRVGLMGYASRLENVLACLTGFASALSAQGMSVDAGKAVVAAQVVHERYPGAP